MGLDLIDLKFRIEQELGVCISGEEFQRLAASGAVGTRHDIRTRDLLELIHQRLRLRESFDDVESLQAWVAIRVHRLGAAVESSNAAAAKLSDRLTVAEQQALWQVLVAESPIPPPPLRPQKWLQSNAPRIPTEVDSLERLACWIWERELIARNIALTARNIAPESLAESFLWHRLRELVADVVAIDVNEVMLDSRLISDLGAE